MALPTDSNDTFIKEVEENLRRDRMQDFFKTYGKWVALGVVLFLAAVGGWIYWQEQRKREASEQSEQLHSLLTDLAAGRTQTVPQRVAQLETSHSDVVRASAMLTEQRFDPCIDRLAPAAGNRFEECEELSRRAAPGARPKGLT